MAQRKKRGRAAKAAYFVPTGNGNYVYTGPLYYLSDKADITAKRASFRRLLFGGAMIALSLLCGILPMPGMSNTFYVIVPYAGTLAFAAVSLWKSARISYWGGDSLREYVFEATVNQLPVHTLVCAVFAGISAIGEGLCLILEGVETAKLPLAIGFLLAHAAIAALALIWRKRESALEWEKKSA